MVADGARIAFTALVVAVAVQRLWELRRSARNEAWIREAGGREHAAGQMPWMRALHTAWLVGMLVEVWALERAASVPVAVVGLAVFGAGQALRILAMSTLGRRWTVKVMTLPGEPAVRSGIFRWIRHPNYLGVVLEIAALPMVHGAVLTAIIGTVLNGALLVARIRAEEAALRHDSAYDEAFAGKPRFIPRSSGPAHG
jgi:methyltransferase